MRPPRPFLDPWPWLLPHSPEGWLTDPAARCHPASESPATLAFNRKNKPRETRGEVRNKKSRGTAQTRELFGCCAGVPGRGGDPRGQAPLCGDRAPPPCTPVPRASCGVAQASSQQCPLRADANIVIVCVPRGLCQGVPCGSGGADGGAALTLGDGRGWCLSGAAPCASGQTPAGLSLQPPCVPLPVGGTQSRLLLATPSEVSPAPGAGDSSDTAAASS